MNSYSSVPRLSSNLNEDFSIKPPSKRYLICFGFIVFYFALFSTLFFNFLYTKDNLKQTSYHRILYEDVCDPFIKAHTKCVTRKKDDDLNNSTNTVNCRNKSIDIENCMNEVFDFNENCQIYIYELFTCIGDNQQLLNDKNSCISQKIDLLRCNKYSYIDLSRIMH